MPKESETPLTLSDCHCNICMDIFVEPVTLPCNHTLCNACFQLTVEKASLYCPFCRRRVSSWARYNSRNNTLINVELWEKIKKHFPDECQRRINGQDLENDLHLPQPIHCLSKPGELKKEYEAEITKVEAERRALEQEESKASEEYIERLLAEEEEEQRLTEERKKKIADQLLLDEMLARELSLNLNRSAEESVKSSPIPGPSPPDCCKTSKTKSSNYGDIKKYLSPKSGGFFPPKMLFGELKEENIDTLSEESITAKTPFTLKDEEIKDDITILSSATTGEGKMTKDFPLESTGSCLNICTTSEFNCHGPELSSFSRTQLNETIEEHVTNREDYETDFFSMSSGSSNIDFGNKKFTESTCLLKLHKNDSTEEILISLKSSSQLDGKDITCEKTKAMGNYPIENKNQSCSLITKGIPKRKSQESPTEWTVDSYLNDKRRKTFVQTQETEMNDIQKQIHLEEELYKRYKQEEEDRCLALKIQKEMDREQKTLNRTKGSPDEYHLRPTTSTAVGKSPVAGKHCQLLKASPSQTERNQPKTHRRSHSENERASSKHQTKPSVKNGNVLNCVLNSDLKNVELLPIKQRTIIQMFKKSATN
ncbi:PREDICTED: E3 ubiquitin-protein ligase RNF168 [Thamnophis sirtalis]|uniref:RING-type E3 ubiquitin transferase n=1 Tax=Thamnophis sirtalis TaxID=35019 RepID=A0A6I9YW61_9SAUR|nr:PREDICTED: E3 ubiquitin-protein ligase RNF168 [Thamnophis sirtalis]XP_013928955.1 PREDICTED: E3 ubiquitin-protein ligase RNF168 [Thamnophis sirtalis]